MSIELKLSRSNRIYRPNVRKGMTGVIESLYSVAKSICIMRQTTVVESSGGLGSGCTEMKKMTFICRSLDRMHWTLENPSSVEEISDNLWELPISPDIVSFYITQDTQKHQLLPELLSDQFKVAGKIATCCSLSEPLRGEITVEASMIADGDICRSMTLPIYIILPRLLVCPTMSAGSFSVEFQVSVIINFQSELSKTSSKSDLRTPKPWLAMETLPLRLLRTK
ncbi:hypothetical protein QJS04_geneDACA018501 [Acorus gramineus]|uniref:Uncharacterized protein n=1 Tax=Acorus gramineus TaxID=55184 RepID=A0AAV9AW49_ACOGR|nr:hypothetical protein QJS04_geneDACA018501 [Acorus gramineus]